MLKSGGQGLYVNKSVSNKNKHKAQSTRRVSQIVGPTLTVSKVAGSTITVSNDSSDKMPMSSTSDPDLQTNTYCFGGVVYPLPKRPNDYRKGTNKSPTNVANTNDYDPFHDRNKYRTKRVCHTIENHQFERRVETMQGLLKVFAGPLLNKNVGTHKYASDKLFNMALEVYNRRGVSEILIDESSQTNRDVSWTCTYHWESRGRVRAGQQLCTQCCDLGKAKGYLEKYYLDIMEISKYRTIFCKGCMGLQLKREVGDDEEALQEEMQKLRNEQNEINTSDEGMNSAEKIV